MKKSIAILVVFIILFSLVGCKTARPEKIKTIYSNSINFYISKPIEATFEDSKNGNQLKYRLYVPKDYSPTKKYPVILFLHGAGEIGNDNKKQINGIRNLFSKNRDILSQCILICPQTYIWWNLDKNYNGDGKGTLTSAYNLLLAIMNDYSCDRNRVYLTGLSMGGYATWEMLYRYPDTFAAAVPVCGFSDVRYANKLVNIPIRIYHGSDDTTVSFEESWMMYRAITSKGGKKVELFPVKDCGHNVWDYTYGNRDMISWLFAQNKEKNPTAKYKFIPYFRIVDKNGKTIISDSEIKGSNFIFDGKNDKMVDVEILLSDKGRTKLEKAYLSDKGEFTVYISNKKFLSFIASKTPIDNIFYIGSVLRNDTYAEYKNIIDFARLQNNVIE